MRMRLVVFIFPLLASCIAATVSIRPSDQVAIVSSGSGTSVFDLRGRALADAQAVSGVDSLDASPNQRNLRQHSDVVIGKGDFVLRATVVMDEMSSRGAGISFDGGGVNLDDREWGVVLTGRLFGGGRFPFETQRPPSARPGAPIEIEIRRSDGSLSVSINEFEMGRIGMSGFEIGRIGFDLAAGNMRVLECSAEGDLSRFPLPRAAFSSADGDIDEYRDPSVASDGARALVTAIAVRTADDGTTRETLAGRFVERDGRLAEVNEIDLGGASVEFAVLGYANGDPRPWKLLLQEPCGKRIADHLTVFDSPDGRRFSKVTRLDASASPVRLLSGAMSESGGALVASATTARGGVPRAAAVQFTSKAGWELRELTDEPSCEPQWIGQDRSMVRKPGALDRQLLADGTKSPISGFDAGPTAFALISVATGNTRVACSDGGFPYPLQELISRDLGSNWTKGRTIWGGSASNACSATAEGRRIVVFEGGDKARREHILVLRLTDSDANPPLNQPSTAGTAATIEPQLKP